MPQYDVFEGLIMLRAAKQWLLILIALMSFTGFALGESVIDAGMASGQASATLSEGWIFHPHRLLDFSETHSPAEGLAVRLPATWNSYPDPVKGGTFGAKGCGTFVLEFKGLPRHEDGYELVFLGAATAYQLTLAPKDDPASARVLTNGIVSCDETKAVPQLLPLAMAFHSENPSQVWRLVVQVSNFHYGSGGLWNPIQLFAGKGGSSQLRMQQHGDLLCLGAILIIGLYCFMLFVGRREDKGSLLLAFACFTVAIRILTASDFLAIYIPRPDTFLFNLKYKLEYAMTSLTPTSFLIFIAYMFPRQVHRKVIQIYIAVAALSFSATMIFDTAVISHHLALYMLHIWAVLLYQILVIWRALRQKEEGAGVVILGGIILCLAIAYDTLVTYSILPPPFIIQYGVACFIFVQSQIISLRFAKAFRTSQVLSEQLQHEVARQTRDIRTLMTNVPQGIFQVRADLTIDPVYSLYLEDILGEKDLAGRIFHEVMFQRCNLDKADVQNICEILRTCFGEPLLVWEFNSGGLPREFKYQDAEGHIETLEIDWHPVTDATGKVEAVLVTIRNVSDLRQLQKEAAEKQTDLSLLGELINCRRASVDVFFAEFRQNLSLDQWTWSDKESVPAASLKNLMLQLHTLKGAARGLGFHQLTSLVHEVESILGKNQSSLDGTTLDHHRERILHCIQRYESLNRKLSRTNEQQTNPILSTELENSLMDFYQLHDTAGPQWESTWRRLRQTAHPYLYLERDEAFAQILLPLASFARELGKPEPKVVLNGPPLCLSRKAIRILEKAFRHILTNVLDHGIENPEERRRAGKEPYGIIQVEFHIQEENLELRIQDDGRGVDLSLLSRKALDRGLLTLADLQDEGRVLDCLFADGFSTAGRLTAQSGRGVGMAAVRHILESEGAHVRLVLEPRPLAKHPALCVILELPPPFYEPETSPPVLRLSS
jgi:PAS domain-containing protein/HPt (histidine-containing phosphotransfer) domain-containing protein